MTRGPEVRKPAPPRPPEAETTFERQYARTRHFTLGVPSEYVICSDGAAVMFLRSRTGDDPVKCLWRLELSDGSVRVLADPVDLLAGQEEQVPAPELARRERIREYSEGISTYATDASGQLAVFTLSGRLWAADVAAGRVAELRAEHPVFDPRPDPTGSHIAYVCGSALRVIGTDGSGDTVLVDSDEPDVGWAVAEFVAAEEMGRTRGYWWAPDGQSLLVARVDNSEVSHYYISNPTDPTDVPRRIAYPAVGTANAAVSLSLIALDGRMTAVDWDSSEFEYLVAVTWSRQALLLLVENRAQRRMQVLEVDPSTGSTVVRLTDADDDWLHIVPGLPALTAAGELVWSGYCGDSRCLLVGGVAVTPPGLELREVLDVDDDSVLFSASEEPTEIHVWTWSAQAGLMRISDGEGVNGGRRSAGTILVTTRSLADPGLTVSVRRGAEIVATIDSVSEVPVVSPRVAIQRVGNDQLRSAVLWPSSHVAGRKKLPVLLDPYGGPSSQRVLASQERYLVSQWFADQGFAVVVTDGHGTPARGRAWELSIKGDVLSLPLADQITALQEIAAENSDLDLTRVAIRGWSFGGFMATAAVLRRPDVFHAAIAGAPDSDARLYDTHFKERYLGDPQQHPEHYDRCSLISEAATLDRPLLIIHGMADDNVVIGHSLRFTTALLAAGRPFSMIVLSGVTHMTPQPVVAENLLKLELDFLNRTFSL
jgi:dipeptidyl-peptidase 4